MTTTKKLLTCGGVVPKSVFGLSRQSNLIECKPSQTNIYVTEIITYWTTIRILEIGGS